ncbi:MAG TPA: hypothetical protein VMM57_03790 [Bacteroidota bacterium]|nr:hypothetical protein [Bacteroidota bacterium]
MTKYSVIFFVPLCVASSFAGKKPRELPFSGVMTTFFSEPDTLTDDTLSRSGNQSSSGISDMAGMMGGTVLSTEPASKEGSGTSWIPESSPMSMQMFHAAGWMMMVHGNVAVRYTSQGGPRGGSRFDAPDWFMGSIQRQLDESNQVAFRLMLSLEPVIEGGDGYPLLFQTGESWKGVPLVDRQHPHDLFSELSFIYSRAFSDAFSGFVYLGYPGEPALGPPTFMHRPSSLFIADAPLGHHWQDATHITFGVATLGFATSEWKVEGSVFNGREPDENRFDFDKPRFDSYSGRLSYNPLESVALQVSSGFLKDPESNGSDVQRTTASVLYNATAGASSRILSSLVWGRNDPVHEPSQQSLLAESTLLLETFAVYSRLEYVEKLHEELGILSEPLSKEGIAVLTLGANRTIADAAPLEFSLGAQVSFYRVPEGLRPAYGSHPTSFEITLNIHPSESSID